MFVGIRSAKREKTLDADPAVALVARIHRRLASLDQHVPGLNEIARDLAMSPRTLRRRLQALETSYGMILQSVRLRRAKALLVCADLTVECISEMLGYAEPRSFRQAFHRWTGCSPRRYRCAVQLQPPHAPVPPEGASHKASAERKSIKAARGPQP